MLNADLLSDMAVQVTFLGERPVTVGTGMRSFAFVQLQMIFDVAQFGKSLVTGEALEHLVVASTAFVHQLRLFKALFSEDTVRCLHSAPSLNKRAKLKNKLKVEKTAWVSISFDTGAPGSNFFNRKECNFRLVF